MRPPFCALIISIALELYTYLHTVSTHTYTTHSCSILPRLCARKLHLCLHTGLLTSGDQKNRCALWDKGGHQCGVRYVCLYVCVCVCNGHKGHAYPLGSTTGGLLSSIISRVTLHSSCDRTCFAKGMSRASSLKAGIDRGS